MPKNDLRTSAPIRLMVPADYVGAERVDKYLARRLERPSRAKIQRSIKAGTVTVNGEDVKKSYVVEAGDEIVCRLVRKPPVGAEPEPIPLDVIYEDTDLLVVNKPAGMVVHPAYGHRSGTLVNALLHHVRSGPILIEDEDDEEDLDDDEVGLSVVGAVPGHEKNPVVRPGIVHRLDKDTSGLLVVAKNDYAHRKLARQSKEHTTRRRYQALVWGRPDPAAGRIEGAIGRDPRNRKEMAVVSKGHGKHAVTHYETIEAFQHTAFLSFRLETGRTHQIRVHARHVGHPVLGDPDYGGQSVHYGPHSRSRRAFFRNLFERMPRQALHAAELGFVHPATDEELTFSAPVPADMQYVLDRLCSLPY